MEVRRKELGDVVQKLRELTVDLGDGESEIRHAETRHRQERDDPDKDECSSDELRALDGRERVLDVSRCRRSLAAIGTEVVVHPIAAAVGAEVVVHPIASTMPASLSS
ncbi:hypothetical protein BM92_07210 [Haloferax mediterranei ATCC 33500]|uniref:Uncharacterized protein n=1 Tax=Haloferax mediterranei (strain ATCC 33500 / DSM 1411 / JCM 8866 / NBRC 14739 / NCIMB 2177 / R-4) TaxID=523841 RepID=A0A059TQP5_HALMT|nr:hypothetical protein BM92_07210 [Haloferax mediterranei ATCC 33500]